MRRPVAAALSTLMRCPACPKPDFRQHHTQSLGKGCYVDRGNPKASQPLPTPKADQRYQRIADGNHYALMLLLLLREQQLQLQVQLQRSFYYCCCCYYSTALLLLHYLLLLLLSRRRLLLLFISTISLPLPLLLRHDVFAQATSGSHNDTFGECCRACPRCFSAERILSSAAYLKGG